MSTSGPIDRLLAAADETVDGPDLNLALWVAREDREQRFDTVFSYEIVLEDGVVWSEFLARELPKMTEHFRAKGLSMFGGPGAVLVLWRDDQARLFGCDAFFETVQDLEGIDRSILRDRLIDWRRQAGLPPNPWKEDEQAEPLRQLPGPKPKPN